LQDPISKKKKKITKKGWWNVIQTPVLPKEKATKARTY
jgi:hypothetical protein